MLSAHLPSFPPFASLPSPFLLYFPRTFLIPYSLPPSLPPSLSFYSLPNEYLSRLEIFQDTIPCAEPFPAIQREEGREGGREGGKEGRREGRPDLRLSTRGGKEGSKADTHQSFFLLNES